MKRAVMVAASVLAVAGVAFAAAPGTDATASRARPTKTTTTTSTVAPTTTSTTVPGGGCGGPITITAGGTYTGCHQSTDPTIPAVQILTTAPVTLDHTEIIHAGQGVDWQGTGITGVNLTVTDSKFEATDPDGTYHQRAIELYEPGSLIVEHTSFVDGQGIWMRAGTPTTVRVRYNEVTNIGRYPHPTDAGCCVQFVQLTEVTSPGVEIAWNRVTNIYGQSEVEDNVNLYDSGSPDAANPVDIHHNLIDGAWPRSGDGASFTGSGLLLGDGGVGAHGRIHDNWIINTANVGVSISGGSDNHLYGNRVVSDGYAGAVQVSATWSQGMNLWDAYSTGSMSGDDAHDNSVALVRPDGRADWWLPACDPSTACVGNVNLPAPDAAAEQAERGNFAASAAAAGVALGPDW